MCEFKLDSEAHMNREQENRLLQELFKHATESIIVVNSTGNIKLINPATEILFGYSQKEVYEQKIEILMPDRFPFHLSR